jgi:hypothetical protein
MIKSLVAAMTLTIGLAGYAFAQEPVYRHHHHHRHYMLQPGPSPYAPSPPAQWSSPSPSPGWSSGGDFSCFNPIKCAQTSGDCLQCAQ